MTPARKDELLDRVAELLAELRSVDIPFRDQGGTAASGMPRACLGHVVASLESSSSSEHLATFIDRLHHLDKMVAQNQGNPRAPYRALQMVLKRWLGQYPNFNADEWLYVLAWTQRMLPRNSAGPGKKLGNHRSSTQKPMNKPGSKWKKENPSIGRKKETTNFGDRFSKLEALKKKLEGK